MQRSTLARRPEGVCSRSSTSVNVNSGGKLFGSIYVPASLVYLGSAVYGGVVVGREVTLCHDDSATYNGSKAQQFLVIDHV